MMKIDVTFAGVCSVVGWLVEWTVTAAILYMLYQAIRLLQAGDMMLLAIMKLLATQVGI